MTPLLPGEKVVVWSVLLYVSDHKEYNYILLRVGDVYGFRDIMK